MLFYRTKHLKASSRPKPIILKLKKPLDQKGQAVVEYVLMLVVTLTLILGVTIQLIPQLRDFMQNYAGAYVECLLETGELPPPLTVGQNPQCTLENMRVSGRITVADGGRGGAGGSGASGSNANRSTATSNSNGNSGQGSNNSNGGSNAGPQPRTGSNTGADGSATGSASAAKGPSRGDKLASAANNAANTQSSSGTGSETSSFGQQDRGQAISGVIKAPKGSVLDDDKVTASAKIKNGNAEAENLRKGTFTAPVTKPKDNGETTNATTDLGFQFGLYLRYFLIGGLLLALILMVGTQLNSLRKSWGSQ